ncbi:MAG: hypothetical protein MJE66_16445 [Proteobacteria bacterium]|nr:hypothetical protein [Pseudomonadota bacterium]
MALVALVITAAVSIACGVGIGFIPVVKENLHWNLWFVIPVSGAILGFALGGLQFGIMRVMGQPVRGLTAFVLALTCAVAYVGAEYGVYMSTDLEVEGVEGLPDGSYPMSDLMSFRDYADAILASSSYESTRRSSTSIEYGRMGTTVTYGIDLFGCFLVGLFTLIGAAGSVPYCDRCGRYKRRTQLLTLHRMADTVVPTLEQIHELAGQADYAGLIAFLNEASKEEGAADPEIRIQADERVCPGCNEATLIGTVERWQGNDWKEMDDLAFRLSSGQGETARLNQT